MKSIRQIIPIAALALGTVGVSSNAHANAYAMAYDNVSNFFLSVSGSGTCGTAGHPACPSFGTPTVTSQDNATLNGIGTSAAATPPPPYGSADAPISNAPGVTGFQTNNAFAPLNPNLADPKTFTDTVSWGDAAIIAQQQLPPTNTPGQFANAAENNVLSGSAAAAGNNTSGTTLSVPIIVAEGQSATVAADFYADPYVQAFLDAAAAAGSKSYANANISVQAQIQALDANGNVDTTKGFNGVVFSWLPSGNFTAFQGTVINDPYSLQTTFTNNLPGTNDIYDPTTTGFGAVSGAGQEFTVITDPLVGGCGATNNVCYKMSLSMVESVGTSRVPEPATVALMGLGLAGLGFVARRRGKSGGRLAVA